MKLDANKIALVKPLLYVGGGFLAYKFVLKPLFDKLGLTKSDDSTAIDKAAKLPGWNKDFYKQAVADKKVTTTALKAVDARIPEYIEKAFGTFNDDETEIFTQIKKTRTQAELSLVTDLYNVKYKKNLFERLRDKLSEGEMINIIDYVKDLPLYKPKTIAGLPTVW